MAEDPSVEKIGTSLQTACPKVKKLPKIGS